MARAVRYRILRKIAHGGMAEIFLAMQTGAEGFQKPVVLKRILPAFAADPHFVRMLVDEAHIASSLNHSHLVQVLDLGKSGGQFFLVLEFVDGWSLEQVRRRAQKARLKFPLPLALYIVSSLCRALQYVHQRERDGKPLGIVHRDVSPQNVLLGREGEVKLADFGIAKAAGRREKSATGIIKGKFAYMSPEQSIGGALDARSDLFSVGTLLYILTTGRKPFDAPTDVEVLMQVRRARYEKPTALNKDFSPEVERFIARALRVDRGKRWQSAEQMADRLDAILIKLGQVSGPAALKRWLEALSARDGVQAPGDVAAPVTDVPVGTIELETDDLELHDTASGELAVPSRRAAAGGESAVASALLTVPGPSPASYWPLPVAPSSHVASNGSSGTGAATVVDDSFPVPPPGPTPSPLPGPPPVLAAKPAGPGNNTHEIPTRPVPLFAMLGDALEATPEPYLEIDARPAYGRLETPPVVSPIGSPVVFPVVSPIVSPVLEPRPIIHLPLPAGSKRKADEVADDKARDADRREPEVPRAPVLEAAEAEDEVPERRRKPRRAIPIADRAVVLTPEDPHSLLSNYPPVSPVQRAISRFVTRVAVLAALGGGLYFARPYIASRIPTWPWVVDHMVRPVDKWLRHLPLRFAPSRIAPSASTSLR
jgi:serine/threonine-protein kinase